MTAGTADIPISCEEQYHSMVNTYFVNLLLQHWLDKILFWKSPESLFQKDENATRLSKWVKKAKYRFHDSRKLYVTHLLLHIRKIPDIKKKKLLNKLLNGIAQLRNDVNRDEKIRSSKQTIPEMHRMMNAVVAELFAGTSRINMFREYFQETINEISNKSNQKKNEMKLIYCIKQNLLKEFQEKFTEDVMKSMKFITFPNTSKQVSLSDIFHESDFEVMSDSNGTGDHDPQDRKSILCADIFSKNNVANVDIIEGDPGSGKSIFLKMLCLEFCENQEKSKFKSLSSYKMVFHFDCREKYNNNSFWEYMNTRYRETAENFPEEYVITALKELNIIFAVDGLDECSTSSKELVKDIIREFSNSKNVKLIITTQQGFSKMVMEQFDLQYTKYRVLNIKPIQNIIEQEKFIRNVINQQPDIINAKDILQAFRDKQIDLKTRFARPIDLIMFVTLFNHFPDKIKISHELDVMQLMFNMVLQNMSDTMCKIKNCDERTWSIMEMLGQCSLEWVQNKTDEINETIFDNLIFKIFKKIGFENDTENEVSVEDILSHVFQKQKCTTWNTTIYKFFHPNFRKYLASRVLTEKLKNTRHGTVLEILQELTSPHTTVRREDLIRSVYIQITIITQYAMTSSKNLWSTIIMSR